MSRFGVWACGRREGLEGRRTFGLRLPRLEVYPKISTSSLISSISLSSIEGSNCRMSGPAVSRRHRVHFSSLLGIARSSLKYVLNSLIDSYDGLHPCGHFILLVLIARN